MLSKSERKILFYEIFWKIDGITWKMICKNKWNIKNILQSLQSSLFFIL